MGLILLVDILYGLRGITKKLINEIFYHSSMQNKRCFIKTNYLLLAKKTLFFAAWMKS